MNRSNSMSLSNQPDEDAASNAANHRIQGENPMETSECESKSKILVIKPESN